MIELKDVTTENIDVTKEFLKAVPSIISLDDEILSNAIIALDDDKIIGCLSYEAYDAKGLIRYFVFKKMLDVEVISDLFIALEKKAYRNGINELISIVADGHIEKLFSSLGFLPLDKNNLFLDEESINNTNFKNSNFMYKILS